MNQSDFFKTNVLFWTATYIKFIRIYVKAKFHIFNTCENHPWKEVN